MAATTPTFGRRCWSQLADLFQLRPGEPEGVPNRLAEPGPVRYTLPAAWKTLLIVVALTLGPRLVTAWRIPTPCVDGTNYIRLAQAWENGDSATGSVYRFNLYPPILAMLHQTGLSWELAGKTWGVLCGTLVVLPLFGWVRRQFNDRIATVSCLLYAGHPELVEWCPEMVRDQTFWLLFAASLYVSWRAVTELQLRYFAAVGVLIPLCTLARFEGLFLVIPFAGWCLARRGALREQRRRLNLGVAVTLAVPLLALVGICATAGNGHFVEQFAYLAPLKRVELWWQNIAGEPDRLTPAAILGGEQRLFTRALVRSYFQLMERGIDSFFGLFMLVGLFAHLRFFLRSDHRSTLWLGLTVAVGIWIHQWFAGAASSRYCLSIVILGSRCAAVGLMHTCSRLARALPQFEQGPGGSFLRRTVYRMPIVPALFVVSIGWYAAATTNFDSRRAVAELGRCIRRNYGEQCVIAGSAEQLPLIGYYAQAVVKPLTLKAEPGLLVSEVEQARPEVVVLPLRGATPAGIEALRRQGARLGLAEIDPSAHPGFPKHLVVFARTDLLR